MKMMDEKLKITIAGTVKSIAKIPSEERSWDEIMSVVRQNPLLRAAGDAVTRADKLIKSGLNVFKFDGSADAAIIKEVRALS